MKEVVRANELEDRTHGARSYPYGRERNGSLSHRCPRGSLSCSLSVMQLVCALIQRKATRLLGPTWFQASIRMSGNSKNVTSTRHYGRCRLRNGTLSNNSSRARKENTPRRR